MRQAREVLERVELPLVGKRRHGPVSNDGEGALDKLHRRQAGAMRGLQLALERLALVALGEKEVAVEPREIAVDAFLPYDGLDAVDRRVALGGEPRRLAPVQLLELEVPVVELVRDVRGRHLGHAAGDRAVVQHRDPLPARARR